jgi:hypothetical protein
VLRLPPERDEQRTERSQPERPEATVDALRSVREAQPSPEHPTPSRPATLPTEPRRPETDRPIPARTGLLTPRAKASLANTRRKFLESRNLSLEQFLGAKAFAAAGSLIVVVGVVLFLKYAYDQGWIRLIAPGVRCLMGAAFGIGLIGAGETVRKRIGAFASSGLSATGIATLYATVLIARHVFELIGPASSFFLLLSVTIVGIVLSTRGRRLFTAYISLAGAYAVPFVVGATDPSPVVLPMYLIALLVFGLALAAGMGGVFRSLRPTVWAATALIGALWLVASGTEHFWTAMVFVGVVWSLVHLELCVTVLARRSSWKPVVAMRSREPDLLRWLTGIPEPSVSLSATVWTMVGATYVVRSVDESWQAVPAMLLALACSVLVWRVSPTLDVLRGVVISARTALGCSLCLQAAGLIIAGVSLQFSSSDQDLAWLVLGAVGCVIGRRLEAKPLVVYGLITLGILGLRLWAERTMLSSAGLASFGPWTGSSWTIKTIALGIALLVAAVCADLFGRTLPRVLAALMLAVFLATPATPGAEAAAVAIIWVAIGLAALAGSGGRRWLDLDSMAVAVVTLAIAPVLVAFGEIMEGGRERTLFIGAGIFAVAAQFFLAALVERRLVMRELGGLRFVTVGAGMVLLCVLPLGPDTTNTAMATIWSGIAAVAIALGWRRGWLALDIFGGILAVVALVPWGVQFLSEFDPDGHFLLNGTLGSALAMTATIWLGSYAFLHPREATGADLEQRKTVGQALGTTGGMLLLIATSIEASRAGRLYIEDETARQALLSIWWAIFGVTGLVFGSIQRLQAVRLACLVLIGLAALKVVAYDLTNVSPLWRIASSLALGMLMVLIGVAYARSLQRRPAATGDSDADAPPAGGRAEEPGTAGPS